MTMHRVALPARRIQLATLLLLAFTHPAHAQHAAPAGVVATPAMVRHHMVLARQHSVDHAPALDHRPFTAGGFWKWTGYGALIGAAVGGIVGGMALSQEKGDVFFPQLIVATTAGAGLASGAIIGGLAYALSRHRGSD